jgi:hypothetical protein
MLRIARLDSPGLLHHVMIRGIERRKIFKDDKDRENLIERLSILLPETKTLSICSIWGQIFNLDKWPVIMGELYCQNCFCPSSFQQNMHEIQCEIRNAL